MILVALWAQDCIDTKTLGQAICVNFACFSGCTVCHGCHVQPLKSCRLSCLTFLEVRFSTYCHFLEVWNWGSHSICRPRATNHEMISHCPMVEAVRILPSRFTFPKTTDLCFPMLRQLRSTKSDQFQCFSFWASTIISDLFEWGARRLSFPCGQAPMMM